MNFTKETPILYYQPHSSNRWIQREYLLLPAWCYRVVAPKVSSRKVNILEKAVLGMCRVGAFTALEISDKLDIGADLAALIIKQLTDQTFIDNRGVLTERGLEILERETLATEDMIAGFIFQDPWTGELLPRFIERQEYIDVKFNQHGYPDLVLGTVGKPDYRRAYMPLPVENIIKTQPSPQEILQAVRKHSKALRYRENLEDWEDNQDAWTLEQVPYLKRISFVEENPTPVWLSTFVYLPENEFSTTSWNICDPFGLGDSPLLRRKLEIQINKNPTFKGLQALIHEMIGHVGDTSIKLDDLIQYIHETAELEVESKLTLDIRRWESIFNNLVTMQRAYIEAESLNNLKYLADKLDDVLIKAQKAIESLLLVIREAHPTDASWKILSPNDREHNRNILNGLANKVGLHTPLPISLLNVKLGKIKSTSDYGEGSLRPLLLATLLATRHDTKHPLYLAAARAPDILERLDTLAKLRDQSSHSSSQKLELSQVLLQISTVYEFVSSMLDINCSKSTS